MMIEHGPGQSRVESLLRPWLAPLKVGARRGAVAREMICQIAQGWLAGCVEPLLHAVEVSRAGGVRQVIRHGPDAGQHRKERHLRVGEHELDRLRTWRGST